MSSVFKYNNNNIVDRKYKNESSMFLHDDFAYRLFVWRDWNIATILMKV